MNRTYLLSLKVVEVSTELYPDSTVPKLLMSSAIDGTGESREISWEKCSVITNYYVITKYAKTYSDSAEI